MRGTSPLYKCSTQPLPRGKTLKEEMSSFDIAALIPEIEGLIKGVRVDNIYQTNRKTLLLRLHQPDQPPFYFIAEAGKRLHKTSYALVRPRKPPAFCMALRKHLKNGRITELRQHEFERTVIMIINTRGGEFKLVLELFGDGNIVLVSPRNTILHALTYRKTRDRNVLRGEDFQYAPPRGKNPLKVNRRDLEEIRNLGKMEVVRALTKFLSIGGLYAEEILLRAEVERNKPCDSLTEEEIDRIFNQLHQILSPITTGKIEPCIVFDDEKGWIDVTPIPLESYADFKRKTYETFNEALDEYYTKMIVKERVAEAVKGAEQELAKQKRILQRQKRALEDLKEKIEGNRRIGDTIYMHLNELQFLLQRIMDEKRNGNPWEQIASSLMEEKEAGQLPAFYFHSLKPQRLILNVSVEKLTFPLALRQSIQANAAGYYSKAKKAEKKLEGVKKALQETQAKIEKLQLQRIERIKEVRKPPPKRRKRAWYEKFRWFHSSDGFLVIGGRDATTNEIVIKKHMEPHDKVFHAEIHGAPFVLVKTKGRSLPEQTIKEAAQLAASYSRAWREGFGAADVYWVSPQQISKTPPPGQFLKKGSFMVSGPKNYVRNVQLRVAIGIKREGKHVMAVGGPKEAVASQTKIYVEITPGKKTSGELTKQIRRLLAERAQGALQRQILDIPLEEIQRSMPSGRGDISAS